MICSPVASIFNASVNQGTVPTLWKCADVVPIAKISKPVSVDSDLRLPLLVKSLRILFLAGYVLSSCLILTLANLEELKTHQLLMRWFAWFTTGSKQLRPLYKTIIRACLIDFSKAFDRIDHNILIRKLQLLNVPPILLNWSAAFLRNRQQRVKIGQDKSNWLPSSLAYPKELNWDLCSS